LLSGGVNVLDVSVIPTSGVAWLVKRMGFEAGAVISASHNPVEQNGVKFIDADGLKLPEKLENENVNKITIEGRTIWCKGEINQIWRVLPTYSGKFNCHMKY